MLSIVSDVLCGEEVKYFSCGKCKTRMKVVDTIVLHGTGGASAMSSVVHLCNPGTKVAAHTVVGRDGDYYQMVPYVIKAWHAGVSMHQGRANVNDFSIGVEMDNGGQLKRKGNRFFSSFGREYMPDEVYTGIENGRAVYWHAYTVEQVEAVIRLCRLLRVHYGIKYLVRHSDITSRKVDPGPAFPFEEVKKRAGFVY
ncbi:N-acetylmuramoyl-L-alanine amidase [Butyricimonas hominis]|uniref:N-acetylmuramoyl-L-alanine amidase n=1 Tax=Butyricimonas hominis TaxID=2763032 RepID=UPI0021055B3F|nr:N-acetylmuramoyl-L-alanine amidase [Butyricimonas hominis]